MSTAAESSRSIGPESTATETCAPSDPSSNPLTLFAEASHASPSPTPAEGKHRTMSGGSGPSFTGSFAWYDLASCLWRTFRLYLDGASEMFSVTWPRAGMTRSGIAYQRQPLVPRISETGSSWWRTPQAWNAQQGPKSRKLFDKARRTGQHAITLVDQVRWPTPRSSDSNGPGEHGTGGQDLRTAAGGLLNPEWVEWLMGFPAGWTALEDSETPSSPRLPSGSDAG